MMMPLRPGADTGFEFMGGIECEAPLATRKEAPKAPRGWGLGRGCAPPQKFCVKFTLNSLILQLFVRLTTV